jgi:hypothetical protein
MWVSLSSVAVALIVREWKYASISGRLDAYLIFLFREIDLHKNTLMSYFKRKWK